MHYSLKGFLVLPFRPVSETWVSPLTVLLPLLNTLPILLALPTSNSGVSGLFANLFHLPPLPQLSTLSSALDLITVILSLLVSPRSAYLLYSQYLMLLLD